MTAVTTEASQAVSNHAPTTAASLSKPATIASWVGQVAAAALLGQTLFFKVTGAPETVALFNVVGLGDAGRFATAGAEARAVVLLRSPRTAWAGAVVALGVISGAIMSHITKLGISIDAAALGEPALEPLNGPSLFAMAVVVFVGAATALFLRRGQIPVIGPKLTGSNAA